MSRSMFAAAFVMSTAIALSVEGQTAPETPTLVSETGQTTVDSPMVQAAKRAVAARQKSATPSKVITNETVAQSTGVLSTASEPVETANDATSQTAKAAPAAPATTTSASAQSAAPARAASAPRAASNEVQVPTFDRSPKPAQNTSAPQESPNAGPNRTQAP